MSDWGRVYPQLLEATGETLYMVGVAAVLTVLLGVPLGVLLTVTAPGGLAPRPLLNRALGLVVNLGRALPFIILLVLVAPVTRGIVGTTIGSTAAIVPLTLGAIPFLARLVETSLREIAPGKVEAALSMGARRRDVVRTVLLPESRPSLVAGVTVTVVALISYSAMAGAVGGGGLGDFAIRFGYQQFRTDITLLTVVLLLVIVQLLQWAGDRWARRLAHV
ncbi:methionine ABC transporter permease [Geodermatophilus obscurus]|jgi:D-methionine transport system permease protein|uniref:Binding-protein-dependent transport systems inner membrane component n=1 Tax=Geodermatophilus obscurus (strain ATCC 25078 / DSM 43160 / JCM 3152 / CCUG 61914 / KCC A-0152 / KCTC 9177 / NBRC 13315 / NRRL B-3577 / G-20) TaxID=526225 RepID=D2S7I2_GEOOG|nr:methionine ABC transporter permease [Geodermatophilus obscurus]ADB75441.1 binding-protein-dependent transport systems inner membrane component [Geodermatophilus obscurus DSM 43160]